jgi:hypothetical protein
MSFLRNAWYVAAWNDEVLPGARRILRRMIREEQTAVQTTAPAPMTPVGA